MPTGKTTEIGMRVIAFFEAKYTCSGVCTPGLFYFTLPLDKGIPSEGCLQFLKTEIGGRMTYLGITSLVIGILMMGVFVMQYCLWKSY